MAIGLFFLFFLNGGLVYQVSLAVIYIAKGRMGEFLYCLKADFKQSLEEKKTRAKDRRKKRKKKTTTIQMNDQTETI